MVSLKKLQGAAAAVLFVGATAATTGAAADERINDDLIVNGSLCVGPKCWSGMPFDNTEGALVLRGRTPRITFRDTTPNLVIPPGDHTPGVFRPQKNDWRLIANDVADDGERYFAIEDVTAGRQVFRVDAEAPLNSIYVSRHGNVGFGTAKPAQVLHARTGNTPTLRLEQDESLNRTPQTWDIHGAAVFGIVDATNGMIPFRITRGALTNSILIGTEGNVHIASGNLGIGGGVPTAKLDVQHLTGGSVDIAKFLNPDSTNHDKTSIYLGRSLESGRAAHLDFVDDSVGSAGHLALTVYGDEPGSGLVIKKDTSQNALSRVGIGEVNPTAKLDVKQEGGGNVNIAKFLSSDSTNYDRTSIYLGRSLDSGRAARFDFVDNTDGMSGYLGLSVYGDDPVTGPGLAIKKGGNVGIGTGNPASRLQIQGPPDVSQVRIMRDSTAGASLMSYSASGDLYMVANGHFDGTNWQRLNTGSPLWLASLNPSSDALRFQRAPAGANPVGGFPTLMTIAGTGNVGIGVDGPSARLHTTGNIRFEGLPNCSAGIQTSASGELSCVASTRRLKSITGDLKHNVALSNIMALRPQVGAYKKTPDVPEHWLIAEDVAAVDPALAGFADGKPYTVKTQNVVADLVAVVQHQQRQIDELKQALADKTRH